MRNRIILLSILVALLAGCSSSNKTLAGVWVLDPVWLDELPIPQTDEESRAIFGERLGRAEQMRLFIQKFRYEFDADGAYRVYMAFDPADDASLMVTRDSWQVRGDWIIFPDADSLEFHWLGDGKVQFITNRSTSIGMATWFRTEEN